MSNNQWSSFANQHSLVTSASLLLGGLVSIIGRFKWWPIGIYSIVISLFILLVEYPRSGRSKTNSNLPQSYHSRPYQHILSSLFIKAGAFYTNYFTRFVAYLVLSIPCLLTLSTLIGALNLVITASLYLLSNFYKEKWSDIPRKAATGKSINTINPPDRPPPRTVSDIEIKTTNT